MVGLFIKRILLHGGDFSSQENRVKCGTVCSIFGIVFNVLLFIGKFAVGLFSGMISIRSDAFNNLSDAGSSLISLLGFKLSEKKPDKEHPFGHGRLEYVSGLFVSMLIILMGASLFKESLGKVFQPSIGSDSHFFLTVGVLVFSVLVKFYMCCYNRKYGKMINSAAMSAASADSISDCITTLAVLVSAFISRYTGFYRIDGICGIAVSVLILFAGYKAAMDTLSPLLGKAPEKEFIKRICEIVTESDEIVGMHDLIVHDYGPGRRMISLHAEVDIHADIIHLHDLIDNIENQLKTELNCDAVIHMDPVDSTDPHVSELNKLIRDRLNKIGPEYNIHDLRIVPGPTHTNVIFDLVLPQEKSKDKKMISDALTDAVKDEFPDHVPVICFENSFV